MCYCKMLTVVNKGVIMISKSTEEYLKTIYVLIKQKEMVKNHMKDFLPILFVLLAPFSNYQRKRQVLQMI